MLKRIEPKPLKRRDPSVAALLRMSRLTLRIVALAKTRAEKKQAQETAVLFQTVYHDHLFLRLRQCIEKAERTGSWSFMHGCFSQATELYAVASIAYELFDAPMMSDSLFDSLASFLLANYEKITAFCKEEWNLNKEIFRAGTGAHFRDVETFPQLLPYYNRLQAEQQKEAQERERTRAKNKTRVLRKASVGTGKGHKTSLGKPLRRPVRRG